MVSGLSNAPSTPLGRKRPKIADVHVGLIGVGRIGAFHAQGLAELSNVDRLTVTDVDRNRAADVAQRLGAQLADTPQALLDSGVDALVIAAATPAHAALLHMAAEARVPAFCEKPIALDVETTDAVIEHVERAGILVQSGFQRRFDAGYRAAREAVSSGGLGDVQLIRIGTHDPAPPPEEYVAVSGGIWRDLAIHDFDIAPWVIDRPVVEVYAAGQAHAPAFAKHDDSDAARAVLRCDGETLGIASGMPNDARAYDVRMEISGLRDSIVVGLSPRTPMRSVEPGVAAPVEPGYRDFIDRFADAYRAELEGFLHAAQTGSESPCTVHAARRALVVALAADRSRRENRPVRSD